MCITNIQKCIQVQNYITSNSSFGLLNSHLILNFYFQPSIFNFSNGMSKEYNPLSAIISIWICNSRHCHALYLCVYHNQFYILLILFLLVISKNIMKRKKCTFLYSYPCIYIFGIFFQIHKINYKDIQHREYSQNFVITTSGEYPLNILKHYILYL